MASQPRPGRPDREFSTRHEERIRTANPAHIHRIRAGARSRGVTTPVSLVDLPVSLTGPGPSGSTGPTRLCRGCSHLPRQPPVPAASSFTRPLRRPSDGGLSPPSEQSSASWRNPGSRAWRLNACPGSLTARGPLAARANAASDVAFRPLGRRRHPGLMISRLNNPAYVSLCQRFTCVLTGAGA